MFHWKVLLIVFAKTSIFLSNSQAVHVLIKSTRSLVTSFVFINEFQYRTIRIPGGVFLKIGGVRLDCARVASKLHSRGP